MNGYKHFTGQVHKSVKCSFSSSNPSIAKIMSKSQYAKLFFQFKAPHIFTNIVQHELGSPVQFKMTLTKDGSRDSGNLVLNLCDPNLKAPTTYLEPFQTSLSPQMTSSNRSL